MNAGAGWRTMDIAPKDGSAFLAFGVHTHSPADAQRGVVAGDYWWGIILWDVWRTPNRWVFSKDGAATWSPPNFWMPLPPPPGDGPARKCRSCGFSDYPVADGDCYWAAPDLCSACGAQE